MKKLLSILILICFTSTFSLHSKEKAQEVKTHSRSLIAKAFGKTPVDCIYLGMWTYHIDPRWKERSDNWNNQAFGLQYKSIFVTTIVNSHYKRSYTFGITRDWIGYKPSKNTKLTFGYRLGGIYGYGKELNKWAEQYPVLPIYQVCSQLQYKRLRFEVSYFRKLVSAYFTFVIGEY